MNIISFYLSTTQTSNSIVLSYWTNTLRQILKQASTLASFYHSCNTTPLNRGTTFPTNDLSRSLSWAGCCSRVDWWDMARHHIFPEWQRSCSRLDFVMGTISCSNRRWFEIDKCAWSRHRSPSMKGSRYWGERVLIEKSCTKYRRRAHSLGEILTRSYRHWQWYLDKMCGCTVWVSGRYCWHWLGS